MIESLLPTAWFTDYWVDYTPVARANVEEAGRLADELGDEQISLEVEAASLRFVRGPEAAELAERLRERLEAGHDPVRLKEHYFWLMWHYLGRGELLRCVQTCDLGHRARPSARLGSGAVRVDQGARAHRARPLRPRRRRARRGGHRRRAPVRSGEPGVRARELPRCDRGVGAGGGCCAGRDAAGRRLVAGVDAAGRAHGGHLAPCARRDRCGGSDGGDRRHCRMPTGSAQPPWRAPKSSSPRAARPKPARSSNASWGRSPRTSFAATSRTPLESLARALSDLGQWDDALDVCDRGLVLCEDTGAVPMAWRLRGCRAHTLDQLGRSDEAADDRARANADFGTLARRIPDPELRAWFNRQPLAARWLG